jgi:16S rRNA (uracil1498-N3)-methyltransferase
MRQFLLPRWYAGEPRITLAGKDAHYLTRVLRMRPGDGCAAMDSRGGRWQAVLAGVDGGACTLELSAAPGGEPAGDAVEITLLQCLPKGRKIDLIVRQATEAGVARIVPLFSKNTVVRPGQEDARRGRLERVAREALQQSGAARAPLIEEPQPLAALAAPGRDWGTALLFHEQPVAAASLHRLLDGGPPAVSLVIGPEGGLDDAEVQMLVDAGFHLVHLGGNVLRVETAALYAVGAVRTILQERDEWTAVRQK